MMNMGRVARTSILSFRVVTSSDFILLLTSFTPLFVSSHSTLLLPHSAAGGRNWEGFGADPFLTGVAAALTVQGIQSHGVIACAKHYIGNEQEHFRGGGGGEFLSFWLEIGQNTFRSIDRRLAVLARWRCSCIASPLPCPHFALFMTQQLTALPKTA